MKLQMPKSFWLNLLIALVLGFLIIMLALQTLGWFTNHGEYLTVPDVKNKGTQEAVKLLESKGFEVVITDSVYTDTLKKGTVVKQIPDPNSTVKINRAVYLTVNKYVPPMVVMPSLEGKGLSLAMDILKRYHLDLGDTTFRPDFMKGSVLEQMYRGERVMAGTKLQWGSKIDLVIGGGLEESNRVVPDVVGLKYEEVKDKLESLGVLISLVGIGNVKDTMNAFIVKQSPTHTNDDDEVVYIKPGMVMDIWLSQNMIDMGSDTTTKKKK